MQERSIHPASPSVLEVVRYVQQLISDGVLRPGDRLPTERELAKQLKKCRGSVRAGIGYLAGLGIVEVRRGVGMFLSNGLPHENSPSLELLGRLRHFSRLQTIEARSLLAGRAAALAAERRNEHQVIDLADEMTEIFASVNCPENFATHEVRFHRLIAESSGNQVLVAVMDMIAAVELSNPPDTLQTQQQRRVAANCHHETYKAIRMGRPGDASRWAESTVAVNKDSR